MAPGLLVYDVLLLLFATATYGGALWAGGEAFLRLAVWVPWPFAVVPAAVVALLALIAEVALLTLLCPRVEPGRYPLMRGSVFWAWIVRSMLRRLLTVPGVKWAIFTSNVLRYLAFKALGARVAFTANMSSDVDVLDPCLLEVGARAVIGARCFTSGHYIDRGQLVLGRIVVGEGALLAAHVNVAPGVKIGANAVVKPLAGLGPDVVIGAGAQIGAEVLLDIAATVGDGADLGQRVHVRPGAAVPAGTKVPANAVIAAGA